MRKLLFVLGPWMAVTNATASSGEPAAVVFTHQGVFSDRVERIGDECFIPPGLAENWGWKVDLHRRDADIDAEGRHLRVTLGRDRKLPLTECLNQLGASYEWNEANTLTVLGQIRSIELVNGRIKISSTLAVSAVGIKVGDPERLAIDLTGAKLSGRLVEQMNGGFRFKQMTPNIVRVVIEGKGYGAKAFSPLVARDFEIVLPTPGTSPVTQQVQLDPKQQPPQQNPTTPTTPPTTPPPAPVVPANLQRLDVTDRSDERLTLQFGLDKAPDGRSTARFTSPTTIELRVPKTKAPAENFPRLNHAFISGMKMEEDPTGFLRITLELNRALTMRYSTSGSILTLRLSPSKGGLLNGIVICVDAGHGGKDPGCEGGDKNEKTLTLDISKRLADKLQAHGATVLMTRNDDTFVELKDRAEFANANGAQIFLSVHINSAGASASGTMTFYHGGSAKGQTLATAVSDQFRQMNVLKEWGAKNDFNRFPRTGMAVLRWSKMPASLLELGFLSHPKDRQLLGTEEYRDDLAEAIVRGLMNFCGDEKNLEANP